MANGFFTCEMGTTFDAVDFDIVDCETVDFEAGDEHAPPDKLPAAVSKNAELFAVFSIKFLLFILFHLR